MEKELILITNEHGQKKMYESVSSRVFRFRKDHPDWFIHTEILRINDAVCAVKAEIVEEPHVNPAPQHREIWLRDLDGYFVVVCSPDGEAKA